jgi:hypothetical protein
MNFRALGILVLVCFVPAAGLAQGPRRDGRWDVKMEMSMPGMPAMPPMTTTQCITKEEAADPLKSVPQGPQGRGSAPNCKMADYKETGNKINFVMTCEPPDGGTMTGELVYANDTYEGTMKMEMNRGGQAMAMTMKYSGKRLGDCTK